MHFRNLYLVIVLALASPQYGSNPFVGRWKIDEANSHIAGNTDSVTAAGPNVWKFQFGNFSWTVKADGTDQPTPFGTTAMKVVNPTTWQFSNKTNGKPAGDETWVLSADGRSMTRTFTAPNDNGEMTNGVEMMKRTSGTSGFQGTWESTAVQMPFTEIDIFANGEDGVTLRIPADGTTYSLKFDGKDYPEQGPRIPAGLTVSARRTGDRTVQAQTTLNGKPFDTEDWEISADGNTFKYTEHDAGSEHPVQIVLHRMQ